MFASRAWEIFIFYYHLTLSRGHLNCTSPTKVNCAADALHDKVSLSLSIRSCAQYLLIKTCIQYLSGGFKRTLSNQVFCYRLAPFYNSGPTYHESLSNHWESGTYSLFWHRLWPSSLVCVQSTFTLMIKSFLYFLSIHLHWWSVWGRWRLLTSIIKSSLNIFWNISGTSPSSPGPFIHPLHKNYSDSKNRSNVCHFWLSPLISPQLVIQIVHNFEGRCTYFLSVYVPNT